MGITGAVLTPSDQSFTEIINNGSQLDEGLETTSGPSLGFPTWLWQVSACVRVGEAGCIHCLCSQSRGKKEKGPRTSPRVLQAGCFRIVGAKNAL